ncbi:unnamed protein product, partial [Closterium sp. NIES-53]
MFNAHTRSASRTRTYRAMTTPPGAVSLACAPIFAASRLQPSHAAVAEATSAEAQVLVGTQMTISGLAFSRRRLHPSTSGDDQEVGTRMTGMIKSPSHLSGRRLLLATSDTTAPSEYPDEETSITSICGYFIVNPCSGGTCINHGMEDWTCVCQPNHRSHGIYCDQDWEAVSSITVAGSDWRCKDVYTMYGLTLQQFTAMNPGINCSALLPQGRELEVEELLPACSAFYYVQP